MQSRIEAVGEAALRGEFARIVIKMNALTDVPLIEALLQAGQKGACIDLIVRGACMLPADVAGKSENIRVRSVIGRFLEHSRVFYFCAGEDESLYLSSADWMSRNMTRRIELAWPVRDAALRQRIIDECLIAYLHDGRDAWDLAPDGQYHRVGLTGPGHGAQAALMARYSAAHDKD
jgi:polyphosphate kinase